MFGASKEKQKMKKTVARNVMTRKIDNAMKAAEKTDKAKSTKR